MDAIPDIVDLVLGLLVMLSVAVWTIALAKLILFYNGTKYNLQFREEFDRARTINDLSRLVGSAKGSLARICRTGIGTLNDVQKISLLDGRHQRDILLHAMQQQVYAEQTRMENGLGVLASIGATSPFIGLFGTVWGIMHALKNISATGSAGLDVVAGPIGEALIATAIGIATAVPAVLAYNYFLRKVRTSSVTMDHFATAFYHLAVKCGLQGG